MFYVQRGEEREEREERSPPNTTTQRVSAFTLFACDDTHARTMAAARQQATRAMRGLSLGGAGRPARPAHAARAGLRPRASGEGLRGLGGLRGASASLSAKSRIASVASLGVSPDEGQGGAAVATTREVTTSKAKGKYKLKTRKAAAKRFKVTGNGKVMRRKQGKQHLNTKKNSKRKRFLGAPAVVEKSDIPNIKGSMPNHKIKG